MNQQYIEHKSHLLIIEDEIESRKYLQLILRKKYELDFCDSEKSMYDLLGKNNYEAIIMDISLKGGNNGVDLIKDLRRNSDYKDIPIICLSAHLYGSDKLRAEHAGIDVYLTKPVGQKVLLNALDTIIVRNFSR
jgi:DNA-binding response OmpR family regulator